MCVYLRNRPTSVTKKKIQSSYLDAGWQSSLWISAAVMSNLMQIEHELRIKLIIGVQNRSKQNKTEQNEKKPQSVYKIKRLNWFGILKAYIVHVGIAVESVKFNDGIKKSHAY